MPRRLIAILTLTVPALSYAQPDVAQPPSDVVPQELPPEAQRPAEPVPPQFPTLPPPPVPLPATEARLAGAAAAIEAGRLADAERELTTALDQVEPAERGWVWLDLCLTHYLTGAEGAAINDCYRALQLASNHDQAEALLDLIGNAVIGGHRPLGGLRLPPPDPSWFIANPGPLAHGTLAVGETEGTRVPAIELGSHDVLRPDQAERLRTDAPPSPYRVRPEGHEYTRGYDVEAKTGLLFYAPDSDHTVVGARITGRRKSTSDEGFLYAYAEYLQGIDGNGGIGAGGIGVAGDNYLGIEFGAAVPWGKDARRQSASFPGHDVGLHLEARLSYRRHIVFGHSHLTIEGSISGGVNVAKLMIRFKDALGDICTKDDCPKTPDGNPLWRMGHWMVNLSIGFGTWSGYGRYAHPEVYAPIGAAR